MNVKLISLTKAIGIPELTVEEDLIVFIPAMLKWLFHDEEETKEETKPEPVTEKEE